MKLEDFNLIVVVGDSGFDVVHVFVEGLFDAFDDFDGFLLFLMGVLHELLYARFERSYAFIVIVVFLVAFIPFVAVVDVFRYIVSLLRFGSLDLHCDAVVRIVEDFNVRSWSSDEAVLLSAVDVYRYEIVALFDVDVDGHDVRSKFEGLM